LKIKEIFLTITFTILFLSISNILPIIYAADPNSTMAGTNVTMAGTNVTMAGTNVTMAGINVTMVGTNVIMVESPFTGINVTVVGTNVTMGGINFTIYYIDTDLSLQVKHGSSEGYIQVFPTLTYYSGNKFSLNDVSIYVDGNYTTKVSSNQLSSNIFVGSGSHTIMASVPELSEIFDNRIRYKASNDTIVFVVPPSIPPPPPSPDDIFPIEYVIAGIVILVIVGVIAIFKLKSKPKKIARAFCGICGANIVSKSKFCRKCGNILQK